MRSGYYPLLLEMRVLKNFPDWWVELWVQILNVLQKTFFKANWKLFGYTYKAWIYIRRGKNDVIKGNKHFLVTELRLHSLHLSAFP